MKNYALVTGGFGFLGSHLVDRLLHDGTQVHVVDNLSTSSLDVQAFTRARPNLTYDLRPISDYIQRPNTKFNEIYHLASVVGPVGVLGHAGRIVPSIVDDLQYVIRLAQRNEARLCDISTSEIYGGGRNGLCSEDDPKIVSAEVSARLEYAVAKLACEVMLINTARGADADLFAVIIRPFNIAGPRQSSTGGFVLPRFIRQAIANEPLTVYGDGTAIRAFTHVADVVDGIVRATRIGEPGTAYNIGNSSNRTTILDLAKLVIRLTGSSSKIDHVDPKALHGPLFAEAADKYPDSTRALRDLRWIPKYDLEQVVSDTIDYIRGKA